MNSNNNNNKKQQSKKGINQNKKYKKNINPFSMDIRDDFYDPFNRDIFGFDLFEDRMYRNFRNIFTDFGLLSQKEKEEKMEEEKEEEEKEEEEKVKEVVEKPKKVKEVEPKEEKTEEEKEEEIKTDIKKEEPKEEEEEINTDIKIEEAKEVPKKEEHKKEEQKKEEKPLENNNGTYYSKVYYSSYNNLNGEPNEECYQSQSVKQMNNGHDISETKEAYKNSNGVEKTAYQRGLDGKTTRFIKEKNNKTGKHVQHRVIKGVEEEGIKDFNKEYNEYSKKCGFRKNFHNLDIFDPFGFNKKQLSDGNHFLLHKLLF